MTDEEKREFDDAADTSYLFRLMFQKFGFEFSKMCIGSETTWHMYYKRAVIGAVTYRPWTGESDKCVYTNLRLYKRFMEKFPLCEDFRMSDFYLFNDGVRSKFDTDKFDKYATRLLECAKGLEPSPVDGPSYAIDDCIARLREFCEEYDDQFSGNTLFNDVKMLLAENDNLRAEINKRDKLIVHESMNT